MSLDYEPAAAATGAAMLLGVVVWGVASNSLTAGGIVLAIVLLGVVSLAGYAHLALIARRMRDELRRRDAEGCRHGHGPDGKRREEKA